jgi:uncharacterized protein (DUF1800 family)
MKFIQKTTAFLLTFLMISPIFAFSGGTTGKVKPLTDEQKIMHVLNRLGFGARPNDIAKVKAVGLQKYIEQQLNANSINDSVAENKVKDLDVMNLSTTELFAQYPNPGGILRMLEQQGKVKNGKVAQTENARRIGNEKPDAMPAGGTEEDKMSDVERSERRQKIAEIYGKYGFKQPNAIPQQIIENRVLRAVYSERQLQEVMVDFWQNHFNVYAGKNFVRWYIPSYERDVLRKNALGNFKDLLIGTAQHPAMLVYLDNFENVAPNSQAIADKGANKKQTSPAKAMNNPKVRERIKQQYGLSDKELDERLKQRQQNVPPKGKQTERGINENYARELMELHTLGVDGGYTQADIIEVAKCFTGWTVADPRGYRRLAVQIINGTEDKYQDRLSRQYGEKADSGTFIFNQNRHVAEDKIVMGQKIKTDGLNDGLKVLEMLVDSPATAKFIAKKLAVKFVSDNPSEAFVGRIAEAFHKSKGDVKTTLKAIFNDAEFFAPENYRAKIKTPIELAVSSIRTLGADTKADPAMIALLQKMGEVPYGYQAPTGYGDTAEDWVNTGSLLERLNYAIALSSGRIPNTKVDLSKFAATDKAKMLDNAIAAILDGEISPTTKANLLKQIEQPLPEAKAGNEPGESMEIVNMRQNGQQGKRQGGGRVRLLDPSGNPEIYKIVSLVLGTPEFQRQ